jgi:hypothetical protein
MPFHDHVSFLCVDICACERHIAISPLRLIIIFVDLIVYNNKIHNISIKYPVYLSTPPVPKVPQHV